MNYKQKLGYMALGAVILAVGITIGQFVTPNIEAQSNGVFDTITCRELRFVGENGTSGGVCLLIRNLPFWVILPVDIFVLLMTITTTE